MCEMKLKTKQLKCSRNVPGMVSNSLAYYSSVEKYAKQF